MANIGYIYKTTNIVNDKIYIGQHQFPFFDKCYYGGSAITAINNNRQLDLELSADCVLVANPTISTVGTFVGSHVIGSATGGASKSGGSTNTNKYLMAKSTTYLFKFITDVVTTRVTHSIFWDELH